MKNLWIAGALLVCLGIGCLASEDDLYEEGSASLRAPGDECVPGDVIDQTDDADADATMPGSAQCCAPNSDGSKTCKGGGRYDTKKECEKLGGKWYGSGGECAQSCGHPTCAEPAPIE